MGSIKGEQQSFEIDAAASVNSEPPKVLKHDDLFGVFDQRGDCGRKHWSAEGLYYKDTRHLSKWDLRFDGNRRPLLLSSIHDDDGSALTATLANPTMASMAKDLIGVTRTKFLWSDSCHERMSFRNYDIEAHRIRVHILLEADFADMFQVRGSPRNVVPHPVQRHCTADGLIFEYVGLDNISRRTEITFLPPPEQVTPDSVSFELSFEPGGTTSVVMRVRCADEMSPPESKSISAAYRSKRRDAREKCSELATVISTNDVFNKLMCRCTSDVFTLLARTPHGFYPHAGIPWYSTVFGRDGLITAMFMLWADPNIARGVLLYLAHTQATMSDPAADAEPGQILHEERRCEMANTGEVPFGRYYGTVDATPLFVVLAGEYWHRTGDIKTIRQIWPNIRAAMQWCERRGETQGEGLLTYQRKTSKGLANQGWKDSHDSVFHADGSDATGPIALVEVQAYLHKAYQHAAALADALDDGESAQAYRLRADKLEAAFHQRFWMDDAGTYAMALDGTNEPCRIITSNAAHVLISDLAPIPASRRLGHALMASDMWSGWGVRTLSTRMPRYNPMSYHNGSVWPHDNALVAIGLARYGMKREAARIFEGLFAAQSYQSDSRLPELFCGMPRRRGRGPVSYPVSCSPQAWAAAAPFALLSACLGLDINYAANAITFRKPLLPPMLKDIRLKGLRLGANTIDVHLAESDGGVAVDVTRRAGDIAVSIQP